MIGKFLLQWLSTMKGCCRDREAYESMICFVEHISRQCSSLVALLSVEMYGACSILSSSKHEKLDE